MPAGIVSTDSDASVRGRRGIPAHTPAHVGVPLGRGAGANPDHLAHQALPSRKSPENWGHGRRPSAQKAWPSANAEPVRLPRLACLAPLLWALDGFEHNSALNARRVLTAFVFRAVIEHLHPRNKPRLCWSPSNRVRSTYRSVERDSLERERSYDARGLSSTPVNFGASADKTSSNTAIQCSPSFN
jgi:hypothetical protein